MPTPKFGNRIAESSTTTGTGSYTLSGAATGYRTFASDLSTGDTCYYLAVRENDGEYEIGLGTFTSPSTLARTTIINSSNADAAVNWDAGTTVVCQINVADNDISIRRDFTAGATLAVGDLCYLDSSGEMVLTDADAVGTSTGMLALCNEALTSSDVGEFILFGSQADTGLTAGQIRYVSTTAGAHTATAPSATGDVVRVIGYAISATELFFNPDRTWVEL